MSAQTFRHTHRVTYAEVTVGNHIYYARYLDLLEAARGEFFRSLGATFADWQARDVIFPVVECQLRYQAPARYDDVLTIETWLTAAEKIRLSFAYRILNQSGETLVTGATKHVCTSLAEKPQRLPGELAAKLAPFVQPAD